MTKFPSVPPARLYTAIPCKKGERLVRLFISSIYTYLFDIQLKRQHEHCLAAFHAVEEFGVAEGAAGVFGEGFDEGLPGFLLAGLGGFLVAAEHRFEERARSGEYDAADVLVGREVG